MVTPEKHKQECKANKKPPFAIMAKGGRYVCRAPTVDATALCVTQLRGSVQALPRHTEETTYCCFLPDLTGFMGFCCAGPERQHHSTGAGHKAAAPQVGIQPCYSGLQVQGTATSPPSTTFIIILVL
ncbi:hypothetical protein JNUCC1_01799 [Lentibacillus sp. JNUCC-1]|nr:hypothetical protein [Lentibacillus sp. JNUCC-1]